MAHLLTRAVGFLATVRARPELYPAAWFQRAREWLGGHDDETTDEPHLRAAIDWLTRAQDATGGGGIARGYSLTWNRWFRARGWQPAYPETTGYIIPTLFEAARRFDAPDLAERAVQAALWEIAVQLRSGAVRGGVMGEVESPAVFNTGQVLFGWLSAFLETGDGRFADAARRAGRFLVSTLSPDGHWRDGNSRFAHPDATLYNARAAWSLAEAGRLLQEASFTQAAARNLRAVAREQAANGWFPRCCLTDPTRPLLHTLAYTVQGLLEGGRVLGDDTLISCAQRTAEALTASVRGDGWMAGRYLPNWAPAVRWSCLTGEAQMANVWIGLHRLSGSVAWLSPADKVLRFLKRTQDRSTEYSGIRGGIKGSYPMGGGYGPYEVLSWATKFFADALIRHERSSTEDGSALRDDGTFFLA